MTSLFGWDTPAAAVDENLRRKDASKEVLELLAGAVVQVADNLDSDTNAVRLAGFRIAGVPSKLNGARTTGSPTFAGIGETLPRALDELALLSSRALTAIELPEVRVAIDRAKGNRSQIETEIDRVAHDHALSLGQSVQAQLKRAGIESELRILMDVRPAASWLNRRPVLVCAAEDSDDVYSTLLIDSEDGIEWGSKVEFVFVDGEQLAHYGIVQWRHNQVLPLGRNGVEQCAVELDMPVRPALSNPELERVAADLLRRSAERVRQMARDSSFAVPPGLVPNGDSIRSRLEDLRSSHLVEELLLAVDCLLALAGRNRNRRSFDGARCATRFDQSVFAGHGSDRPVGATISDGQPGSQLKREPSMGLPNAQKRNSTCLAGCQRMRSPRLARGGSRASATTS